METKVSSIEAQRKSRPAQTKCRKLLAFSRLFSPFVLAIGLSSLVSAQTPAPNTTQWENDSLKLRLFYPSDLVPADIARMTQNGVLTLLGVSTPTDAKLAETVRCLRPRLALELPRSSPAQAESSQATSDGGIKVTVTPSTTATILLAELDVTCLSGSQADSTHLLTDMVGVVSTVPGMASISPPSAYTIGWQKVHMVAAQGQPQASPPALKPTAPQQLFTMGISTNWQSRLLVWYFSSNNIDTLNRITKTTVRFGRAQAEPLYPIAIGTTAR